MVPEAITRRTYNNERIRAFFGGVLESAWNTFYLLIAVKVFEASPTEKAVVGFSGSIGFMLSPFLLNWVEKNGFLISKTTSCVGWLSALALAAAAFSTNATLFVGLCAAAMTLEAIRVPLLTQVYQENYPPHQRGMLFSRTAVIRLSFSIVFAWLFGRMLDGHLERYRILLLIYAFAACMSAWFLRRMPTGKLKPSEGNHPLRAMKCLQDDKPFRWMMICWMIIGFANLIMLPLRVDYLANPRYGLNLSVTEVAVLTAVIPNVARMLLIPFWGWAFDRFDFKVLRMALTFGSAIGVISFFTGNSQFGLLLGAIFFGIANAGGDVSWSLWVTKYAKPEKVASYMSVHVFFAGFRGVLAPMLAFHAAANYSISTIGWCTVGMLMFSNLIFLREIRKNVKTTPRSLAGSGRSVM
jgi:hypothetical protein